MKNKILFILSLLLGLLMINGGLDKFIHYMPMPKDLPPKMISAMKAFEEIGWLMPLVGFAELLGGILIIIPRFRVLGSIVLFPIMIGILMTNIFIDNTGLPIVIVLFAILGWIFVENKEKYFQLIK